MATWVANHPTWVVVAAIVSVAAIGAISIWRGCRRLKRQREFAGEYLQQLQSYIQSRGKNLEAYGWMTQRSERMQAQLGTGGILSYYQRPFAQVVVHNVPVILNILPDLRIWLADEVLRRRADQLESILQEVVLRHIGLLNDTIEASERRLLNPLGWLREGVSSVLLIPFTLLAAFGVVTQGAAARISASTAFRIAAGISSLVAFIAAIATIAGQWDELVELASRAVGR